MATAIACEALALGHRVVSTLRDEGQRRAFKELAPGSAHGRLLDVSDKAAIAPLVQRLEADIGPLDAAVNNTGYGLQGV